MGIRTQTFDVVNRAVPRAAIVGDVARRVPAAAKRFTRQQTVGPGPGDRVNLVSWVPGVHQSFYSVAQVLESGLNAAGREWAELPAVLPHDSSIEPELVGQVTLAHSPLTRLPHLAASVPRAFSRGRFVAAVGYAEARDMRPLQRLGVPFVDEIWTISDFCAEAFATITAKPVRTLPYPFPPLDGTPGALREYLNVGDRFLFGFQFDARSTLQRKNPEGLIRAYRAAFPAARDDTCLIVKTLQAAQTPGTLEALQRAVGDRGDIAVIDEFWPESVNASFFLDLDCYVSLHRAEGLGIGMGMAMTAGTPVIATGYSGNLDFMSDDCAVLVPYHLVAIGPHPQLPAKSLWAEPDLDAATDAMRAVRDDSAFREQLGRRAAEHVAGRTTEALGAWCDLHLPR